MNHSFVFVVLLVLVLDWGCLRGRGRVGSSSRCIRLLSCSDGCFAYPHGWSRASARFRFGFILYVSLAAVKPREEEEQHRGDEHDFDEEKEITRAGQLKHAIFDQKVHSGGEKIAKRDRAEVSAHHER